MENHFYSGFVELSEVTNDHRAVMSMKHGCALLNLDTATKYGQIRTKPMCIVVAKEYTIYMTQPISMLS